MRRVLGLTWVGWLNFFLLRWFFVRVFYVTKSDGLPGDRKVGSYGIYFPIWPAPWPEIRRVSREWQLFGIWLLVLVGWMLAFHSHRYIAGFGGPLLAGGLIQFLRWRRR